MKRDFKQDFQGKDTDIVFPIEQDSIVFPIEQDALPSAEEYAADRVPWVQGLYLCTRQMKDFWVCKMKSWETPTAICKLLKTLDTGTEGPLFSHNTWMS